MRLALMLSVCCALGSACVPRSPDGDAPSESELTMRMLIAAWQTADTALISEIFWPDATYDDYPNQVAYQGVEEIIGYVTGVHAWADDVYMNIGSLHVTETGAVAEWVFAGVQNRPMGDFIPVVTGREVVLNGVTIIEMDGGRITRAADYTDTAPIVLQLGGRIELPGGGVIEIDDGR